MFDFLYKIKFNNLFKLLDLKNNLIEYPKLKKIDSYKWGFIAYIDISRICSYEDIKTSKDFIKQYFRGYSIDLFNLKGYVVIELILNDFEDLKLQSINLPNNMLCLGYDIKSQPIIVDMFKTPHIGVQGLSNVGKSIMIHNALSNLKNADIYLLNCFIEDFNSIKATRINQVDDIANFLDNLMQNKKDLSIITYVIIDEVNFLHRNKSIIKVIENLLSQARHYNIFIICIGQILLKENCPYKQFFNVRVTFKSIDKSVINNFLNYNLEDVELMNREFYIYSDSISKGKTYLR